MESVSGPVTLYFSGFAWKKEPSRPSTVYLKDVLLIILKLAIPTLKVSPCPNPTDILPTHS